MSRFAMLFTPQLQTKWPAPYNRSEAFRNPDFAGAVVKPWAETDKLESKALLWREEIPKSTLPPFYRGLFWLPRRRIKLTTFAYTATLSDSEFVALDYAIKSYLDICRVKIAAGENGRALDPAEGGEPVKDALRSPC
jgi:hypothetical protein